MVVEILLIYENMTEEYKEIPKIYPNKNVEASLSNGIAIEAEMEDQIFLFYCKIKQNELNYFSQNNLPIAYDILCGRKEETAAIVHILDKTRYPFFRVKGLVMPNYHYLQISDHFSILADIEGSISVKGKDYENSFIIFINVENNNRIKNHYLYCEIPNPSSLENNFEIECHFRKENNDTNVSYSNIYLTTLLYYF